MPRVFQVPEFYKSQGITAVKHYRRQLDPRKKDLTPSVIDFGSVVFKIGRHFGFCFGVENAIEIAYRTVEDNPERRIFLLSEMIHNPGVNADLQRRGVRFLMDTEGNELFSFDKLTSKDIVIVPAFGTTVELHNKLSAIGIDPYYFDTTCPFVEKVWKRGEELGRRGFSVIIHGKRTHEETRATFSHSKQTAPTLVILNLEDAKYVADFIKGKHTGDLFKERFQLSMSENFSPEEHLSRIGIVNQTTMLATETQAIMSTIRDSVIEVYGEENLKEHFADTRDTLCYATYENQSATRALINSGADIAVVVGGYNSSNTSHLVELCENSMPTYYIRDACEIIDRETIKHFDLEKMAVTESRSWLPNKDQLVIALTSGASCPDKSVDDVLQKIVSLYEDTKSLEEAFSPFLAYQNANIETIENRAK